MEPILSVVCNEPHGPVYRHIYPLALTHENLHKFWEKARVFPTIFVSEIRDDFKKFCELFIAGDLDNFHARGLLWVVDDWVGVYYITHITENDALVHYTFFDGRQRGREELTREMLRYAFRRYEFWRLSVEVPLYVKYHVHGFVLAIGFKKEGIKRDAVEYEGKRCSVVMYGITRKDSLGDELEWEQHTQRKAVEQQLV